MLKQLLTSEKISLYQKEDVYLQSQVSKYKQLYMNKSVSIIQNNQTFIHFSRELFLLLNSYCKNIVLIEPDKLDSSLEHLYCMYYDLMQKFKDVAHKYQERIQKDIRNQSKCEKQKFSTICEICSHELRKIEVSSVKSHLLNEVQITSKYFKSNDEDQKQEEYDQIFYDEVNDLLNAQQRQIVRNQADIMTYQDVALHAIEQFNKIKEGFNREGLAPPNLTWITEAKQELNDFFSKKFQGKIPPWIQKMLLHFVHLYKKETHKNMINQDVQTITTTQTEILEIRKKYIQVKDKFQKCAEKYHAQNKEYQIIQEHQKQYEIRMDFYRKEINRLKEQIQKHILDQKIMRAKINRIQEGGDYHESTNNFSHKDEMEQNESRLGSRIDVERKGKQKKTNFSSDSRLPFLKSDSKQNLQNINEDKLKKINRSSIHQNMSPLLATDLKSSQRSNRTSRYSSKKRTIKISGISSASSNQIQEAFNSLNDEILEAPENDSSAIIISAKEHAVITNQNSSPSQIISPKQNYLMSLNEPINEHLYEGDIEEDRKKIQQIGFKMKQISDKRRSQQIDSTKLFSMEVSSKKKLKKIPNYHKKILLETVQELENNLSKREASSVYEEEKLNQYEKQKQFGVLINKNSQKVKEIISEMYHNLNQLHFFKEIDKKQFQECIYKLNSERLNRNSLLNSNQILSQRKQERLTQRISIKNKKENSIFEKACKYENSRFNERKTKYADSLNLFEDEVAAYAYEHSLIKNHYSKEHFSFKLSQEEFHLGKVIFDKMEKIKTSNRQEYKFICSYLRYPFQTMKNDFGLINFVAEMSYQNFLKYFQKIVSIHRNCERKSQDHTCSHLSKFIQKLKHSDFKRTF